MMMNYYFSKRLTGNFEDAVRNVTEGLAKEGFGILTEIDIKATLKKKLNEDFYNYKILGACNPPFAHKALLIEDKIGTMLPCNVIVQEREPGKIEVSAINPIASMQSIPNNDLHAIAAQVSAKLENVIKELSD